MICEEGTHVDQWSQNPEHCVIPQDVFKWWCRMLFIPAVLSLLYFGLHNLLGYHYKTVSFSALRFTTFAFIFIALASPASILSGFEPDGNQWQNESRVHIRQGIFFFGVCFLWMSAIGYISEVYLCSVIKMTYLMAPNEHDKKNARVRKASWCLTCLFIVESFTVGLLLQTQGREVAIIIYFGGLLLLGVIISVICALLAVKLHYAVVHLPPKAPPRLRKEMKLWRLIMLNVIGLAAIFAVMSATVMLHDGLRPLGGFLVHQVLIPSAWMGLVLTTIPTFIPSFRAFRRDRFFRRLHMAQKCSLPEMVASGVKALNQPVHSKSGQHTREDGVAGVVQEEFSVAEKQSINGMEPHAEQKRGSIQRFLRGSIRREQNHENEDKPVWQRGVSLAFLQCFVFDNNVPPSESTKEVCDRIVKPQTQAATCSMWHALAACGAFEVNDFIGKPTCFVSHAWANQFNTLVSIAASYDSQFFRRLCFFVDCFCMNQHDLSEVMHQKTPAWQQTGNVLLENLRQSVNSSERFLMCLEPCNNPVALQRCWCQYELYLSRTSNSEMILKFNPASAKEFFASLRQHPDRISDMIEHVKVEDSSTLKEEDKNMIMASIEKEIGIQAFNAFLASELTDTLKITGFEELYKIS
eukprot:gnl/MRDRNA2_/MRDRNA2_141742_c0_seq1.p1 gnl/MRDRNA2_/MRDRNA2_141742_c0~~gnl/MRDRNA2_/MRDRNA2_141742_c0_seq1.p1  ORF type:complete len:637 (-),score=99.41 gnl/MRDRNA2_/MRDRNA2_141742_c0_seq1:239-2149(-)